MPQKSNRPRETTLRVTEIFYSLQGEADTVGQPTVFVRLTGCPLRCVYCDTEYAFQGGKPMSVASILEQVAHYPTRFVTVTGGEPLAQKECLPLLSRLADESHEVSLETSGALDISGVDERVSIVMDIKTPGSGESDKNRLENIACLSAKDQIKFVITDRKDYEWAREFHSRYNLSQVDNVFFSPAWGQMDASDLAQWILEDQLAVRLQLQLHKILWGDQPGR